MNITTRLAAVALLGLLVSCSINPHPMDMTRAVQDAKTGSDHVALAKHYEDAAKEMQAKVDEHKKLLAYYQAQKDRYRNKQAQDLVNHCQGLIRIYDQAATENRMAQAHREMAAEAK